MASNWITVKVVLTEGRGQKFSEPPGRIMLVGPRHTFTHLAESINTAFARWDLSHLWEFELADGRRIGPVDPDADEALIDADDVTVTSAPGARDTFSYVFDFGDAWAHDCSVEETSVDPMEVWGAQPKSPVPIFGWGSIPDQYGRASEAD